MAGPDDLAGLFQPYSVTLLLVLESTAVILGAAQSRFGQMKITIFRNT